MSSPAISAMAVTVQTRAAGRAASSFRESYSLFLVTTVVMTADVGDRREQGVPPPASGEFHAAGDRALLDVAAEVTRRFVT
jgi:hypothetical protein